MTADELTVTLSAELAADIDNRRALDTIARRRGWITVDGYPMTTRVELFIGRTPEYAEFCRRHSPNIKTKEKSKTTHTDWTDAKKRDVQRLYNSGKTYEQIGQKYNRESATIGELVRRMRRDGWELREPTKCWHDPKSWDTKEIAEIRRKRAAGMSYAKVAKEHGVSGSTIARLLTSLGDIKRAG